MSECQHRDFYYYPAVNEEGWKCVGCGRLMPGEPDGFRPDLDREEIYIKVGGLLNDLCDANLVRVSNGSGGDYLTRKIAARCESEGAYDQYSILLFILEEMTPSHRDYWKKVGDGVLSGDDPRRRCDEPGCGKLATSYGQRAECGEHSGFPF